MPQTLEKGRNVGRVVILTALRSEFAAVRSHLREIRETTHTQGTVYEVGLFQRDNGQSWEVWLTETGPGNAGAARETERALGHIKPQVAMFVGVAGGIKDVSIGDVVVATKIYAYESGKAEGEFRARPEVRESSYELQQRSRAEARSQEWTKPIRGSESGFRAFVGPIASGEKVVASRKSELCQFIREQYGDALAVEMEGSGFLTAAQANQNVRVCVVRGISDLIEEKSQADAGGSQDLAARHAAAFAFGILSRLGGSEPSLNSVDDADSTPTSNLSGFRRDTTIDTLIKDVQLGVGKTAAQAALNIVKTTDSSGGNRLFIILLEYQDCDDQDLLWKALPTIECCAELAPSLLSHSILDRMASHSDFSVRSCAASICMNLAQYAPNQVPLDIVIRLSVHTEDWYVQAPANAALKTMVEPMPYVLQVYLDRLRSEDPKERQQSLSALEDIAEKEPHLIDPEVLEGEQNYLAKLADGEALQRFGKILEKIRTVKTRFGYKYGI